MTKRKYTDLSSSATEYARVLPGTKGAFRGVDFSTSPHQTQTYRLADARNVYRDYRSDEGGAVETIPGFRRLSTFAGEIRGIHSWRDEVGADRLIVHAGTSLYMILEDDRDNVESWVTVSGSVADAPSRSFSYNGSLYILDGTTYQRLTLQEDGAPVLVPMSELGYVPKLWQNGEAYEQRNLLTDQYRFEVKGGEGTVASYASLSDYGDCCSAAPFTGQETLVVSGKKELAPYYETDVKALVYMTSVMPESEMSGEVLNLSRLTCTDSAITSGPNIESLALIADGGSIITCPLNTMPNLKRLYLSGVSNRYTLRLLGAGIGGYSDMKLFYGCTVQQLPEILDMGAELGNDGKFNVPDIISYLPPNIVVRQGETVVTDRYFPISDVPADNAYAYSVHFGLDGALSESAPTLHCKDGYIAFSAGEGVPVGRYGFYGKLSCTDALREDAYFFYRVEVVGADSTLKPSEDIFDFSVKPLLFALPAESDSVVGVKDGAHDAPFALHTGENGRVTAFCALVRPENEGIDVTGVASAYQLSTAHGTQVRGGAAVNGCTLLAVHDNRIFLSGNPALPNTVFYSKAEDPTYFGVLNRFNEGGGFERVTALFPFSDTLCVCKEDKLYYRTGVDGEDKRIPRLYVGAQGKLGLGCLGACCNFLDDPVFLTKEGIWGINKETLTLERTLGRRSSTVDARLLNEKDLSDAEMVEWEGYLCLFVNGHVYMADSRAVYTDATGNVQYEWFYLADVGTWWQKNSETGGYLRHRRYAAVTGDVILDGTVLDPASVTLGGYPLAITHEELLFDDGAVYSADLTVNGDVKQISYALREGKAYAVFATDEYEKSGTFFAARHPLAVENRLYFGDALGHLYVFNNDRRGEAVEGESAGENAIHRTYYSFDGHRIESGFATRLDDCDVPHLCKNTVHRSLTMRSKLLDGAAFTLSVYTERKPVYTECFSSAPMTFYGMDLGAASLHAGKGAILVGREKEKRWVEKQYLFCDGGFRQPFGIYSVAYRYHIAGRIRE